MNSILIVGASSSKGQYLCKFFGERNFTVYALSNAPFDCSANIIYVNKLENLKNESIDNVIILHDPILPSRIFSNKCKESLIDTQVYKVRQVYEWLERCNKQPDKILLESSLNYYGICPDELWVEICNEESNSQPFFISELYKEIERESSFYDFQTIIMRSGKVFGFNCSDIKDLIQPIRKRIYGTFSNGLNPINWIHVSDYSKAAYQLITGSNKYKIYNLVSTENLNHSTAASLINKHFNRTPLIRTIPTILLKAFRGEVADFMANGQHCTPQNLINEGFEFSYSNFKEVLNSLYPPELSKLKRRSKIQHQVLASSTIKERLN